MKRILLFFAIFFMPVQPCFAAERLSPDDCERLSDIVVTLLMPEIDPAIEDFYADYLVDPPNVVPYMTKIIAIEGRYTITVDVFPFIGAHNSIGRDRITFSTDWSGSVTVENFEHIESYDIPPHKQGMLKKPLPYSE